MKIKLILTVFFIILSFNIVLAEENSYQLTYGQHSMCGNGVCDYGYSENCIWCPQDCGECAGTFEQCANNNIFIYYGFMAIDGNMIDRSWNERDYPSDAVVNLEGASEIGNRLIMTNNGCYQSNLKITFNCDIPHENDSSLFFKHFPTNDPEAQKNGVVYIRMNISDAQKSRYQCNYTFLSDQASFTKTFTILTGRQSSFEETNWWMNWTFFRPEFQSGQSIYAMSNSGGFSVEGAPNSSVTYFKNNILESVSESYFNAHIKTVSFTSNGAVEQGCIDCVPNGHINGEYILNVDEYNFSFSMYAQVKWNDYREIEYLRDGHTEIRPSSPIIPMNYSVIQKPLLKEYNNLLTKSQAIDIAETCVSSVLGEEVSLSSHGVEMIAYGENKTAKINLENGNILECYENIMTTEQNKISTEREPMPQRSGNILPFNLNSFNSTQIILIISAVVILVVVIAVIIYMMRRKLDSSVA